MKDSEEMVFHTHRDGEEETFYHPITTYIQGSLAEERRKSSGRFGKDKKEFKLVKSLNQKFKLSLYEVLVTKNSEELPGRELTPEKTLIEERLSHLGARYPSVPGLGIYVKGLKNLEGKGQGKKIFDLLFWISEQNELDSYWKYILLSPIGKLLLNLNTEGKWIQNSTMVFLCLGMNSFANEIGRDILQNKSAISDSLKRGKTLAKSLSIQFYSNTLPYKSKVRRRGYSRSSPVRPGSSKKAILEANSSTEYLTESGYYKKSSEGGYEMEERKDLEEIIFKTFKNSLEAYQLYQKKKLEEEVKEEKDKNLSTQKEKGPPSNQEKGNLDQEEKGD